MDRHHKHNDSSEMRAILQPDAAQQPPKEQEREGSSSGSTDQGADQGACSSTSPGPCRTENAGGAQAKEHEVGLQAPGKERELGLQAQGKEEASSCCQLNDLKRLPKGHMKLGPLSFSRTHTVLINVERFNREMKICPQEGRDLWHSDFVKMPFSQVVNQGILRPTSKWSVISSKLKSLASKKSVNVKDVVEAIIKYNPKYKDQWSFDALVTFDEKIPSAENYFKTLYPKIAALALKLPNLVKKAIPLLKKGQSAAITLSQAQIACLLANAFFCTFPHRNTSSPSAEYCGYPSINFNSLFGNWSDRKREKLRAIMHYFKVVTDEQTQPNGLVTFQRHCCTNTDTSVWTSCKETLPKLHITSKGHIEVEGQGMLQVDFAANRIGGGVLGSGLLQEEILFLMNPELIVARLFTEKLGDNECLIITGSQQFSSYSGFGDTFEWAGFCQDRVERDEWARCKRQILAIDALKFRNRTEQYNMKLIFRELNKAYCGFQRYEYEEPDIATGKWGCGAFNGDPELKAVIQLMAAAKANRGLAFFTFGDTHLEQNLQQIYNLMVREKFTVEKLCRLLDRFCTQHHHSRVDLFEFIRTTVEHPRGPSRSLL